MFQKLPGNFSETFLSRDELVITRFIICYTPKKYNFTAVNMRFNSTNPGKFPWENFLRRKILRKIFLTILSNFGNFFRQECLSENSGENVMNFYL